MKLFRANKENGFTLVELMIVVSIILLLTASLFSKIKRNRMRARDNVRIADIDTIRLALEEYRRECGEYPERLDPETHNGCSYGQKLSDFLNPIPVNPPYDGERYFKGYSDSQISGDNTYFYAGLSNKTGGKCYDYHLGVELESTVKGEASNPVLELDHDGIKGKGRYHFRCRSSNDNFGDVDDDKRGGGLYDFQSQTPLIN